MSDWLTWQIVDSAFPTGLFAHSWGLESAWQHGEVGDAPALGRFLDAVILQTGCAALPFVNDGFLHIDRLEALDRAAEAFLTNPVANRASRMQGRALIATTARVWPTGAVAALKARADEGYAHVAPLSGAAFRLVGIPLTAARRIVLFGAARGVLSAAVRLGIVGSYEAQRMQHACGGWMSAVEKRCAGLTVDDATQTAPVVDLLQSAHDRLYSRLFQS